MNELAAKVAALETEVAELLAFKQKAEQAITDAWELATASRMAVVALTNIIGNLAADDAERLSRYLADSSAPEPLADHPESRKLLMLLSAHMANPVPL